MFVDHLNGHHETIKGQFIKWTIYGEMPIGLKSHQDSLFWSIGSLLSEGYYGRPCMYQGLAALSTNIFLGLAALSTNLYVGLVALSTNMSQGLAALDTKRYQDPPA